MALHSVIRLISRNMAAVGYSNWISRNPISGARGVSTAVERVSDEKPVPNSGQSSSKLSSPWLLLPPDLEKGGENMIYNFYSLAENKVLSLNKKRDGEEDSLLNDDAKFKLKGSSHGWLALFKNDKTNIFLYNPVSRRHIKLPPIKTLPFPEHKVSPCLCVNKLILSCSPNDQVNCRAMINYGPADRLAFCCPGRSTEWTPLRNTANYQDFVYSSRKNLFFCVRRCNLGFEAWDLLDEYCPKLIPMVISVDKEYYRSFARSKEELNIKTNSSSEEFLVVPQNSDELYFVRRFSFSSIAPDGSYIDYFYHGPNIGYDTETLPYKTIGFSVHKYDPKKKAWKYMDNGSLDGLAFFIGVNHGFALRASEYPELKPNSIYFTDANIYLSLFENYGGHDLGVFDYENKTFSPCYYPCDVQSIKRIVPPPTWFTPTRPCETSV